MSLEDLLPPLKRTPRTWRIDIDVTRKSTQKQTDDIGDNKDITEYVVGIVPALDSGGYPTSTCQKCNGGNFYKAGGMWWCSRCHPPSDQPTQWLSMPGGITPDGEPKDVEAMLNQAVAGTDISVNRLRRALDDVDLEDVRHGRITVRNLRAFVATLDAEPDGPALSVRCINCAYFQRQDGHPRLGRCSAGMPPDGAAGLWDTDRRHCISFSAASTE
jgi:hypothetical protein